MLVLLALVAAASAQDHGAALRTLDSARPEEVRHAMQALAKDVGEDDSVLTEALDAYLSNPTDAHRQTLRTRLALRARGERPRMNTEVARAAAKASASTAADPDPGISHDSNWLGRVIQRLKNWRIPRNDRTGDLDSLVALGPALILLVKVVLGLLLAGFLIFAVCQFRWRRGLRRRAAALLEESEPERTPDGWLERGEGLAAEERYREAVRCLYLACLLRFDEHGVARFERHETNWEHLVRISTSPKLPAALDFRPPTAAFDRIWYGQRVRGRGDFDAFRAWYSQIVSALEARAA